MKEALDEAGFESGNDNHMLVICGDLFDRGTESYQLLHWLYTIPNKILIRGNHEDLMSDMVDRGYPLTHDISNGTYTTAKDLAWDKDIQEINYQKLYAIFDNLSLDMLDYYETKNYIFVHGWIPVKQTDDLPKYYARNRKFEYQEDWRENGDWEAARWISPIEAYKAGITVPNKTIVCGHWHTSAAHCLLHNDGTEWGPDANFKPFYDNGIIMLDACTAYSGMCNVVILEDELLDS